MSGQTGIPNLNAIAQGLLGFVQDLNNTATQIAGIDCEWMRAIPGKNSEDVIFHEYTLLGVTCPSTIKVVATKTDYNPGNFSVDLFGINYEAPFEVEIDTQTWTSVFGKDTMPQKGDVVYVNMLNCLYEVATSTVLYGFAQRETGFRAELVKYVPKSHRKEPDAIRENIDDLTVSVGELFGDDISKEIADITDNEQTQQLLSTKRMDFMKDCDMDSIVQEELFLGNNVVANSYYDLKTAKTSIIYKEAVDKVSPSDIRYNRMFTCWFCLNEVEHTTNIYIDDIRNPNRLVRGRYGFSVRIEKAHIKPGDRLGIRRGTQFYINAVADRQNEDGTWLLTFDSADVRNVSKKITNWNSNLTANTAEVHTLLLGRDGNDKCNFDISVIGNRCLFIRFGSKMKMIDFGVDIPIGEWCGVGVNIGPSSDAFLFTRKSGGDIETSARVDMGDLSNEFEVKTFYNNPSDIFLTNIRLYATSAQVPESILRTDLKSRLAKNDSDMIINDSAAIPNRSPYIGQQR